MKWSVSISVAAHLALLVLAAGWVRFGDEREPLTPPPIPVDLVMLDEETQPEPLPKLEPEPEPIPEPEPEPEPEPIPEPEPEAAPEPKAEPKVAEKPIVKSAPTVPKFKPKKKPAPKVEPKVVEKPKPKPEPEPEPEKPDFSADNIAALLDKAAKDNPPPKKSVKPTTQRRPQRQQTASAPRMTISEVDAIRQAFYRCWSVPAGARDAENLKVEILVSLRPDGSLARAPDLVDKARLNRPGEEFWRAAAESALRAVYQCTPLALPAEKYEAWRKLQLMFDPSEMVGP